MSESTFQPQADALDELAATVPSSTGINILQFTPPDVDSLLGVRSNGFPFYSSSSALEASLTFLAPLSRDGDTVSIPAATSSVDGYLSAVDWTTFNAKQAALGFTPENVANKVTSFSSPTDNQYPSAKLVKDQLDTKGSSSFTGVFADLTSKPTTIGGYGITDFNSLGDARWPQLSGSYANPSWITSLPWSKITSTPTTIGGYGITDFNSLGDARWTPLSRTISTTAPLTGGNNLSANLTIAIPAATGFVDGYLAHADWTTFNGKENVLTFNTPLSRSINVISISIATASTSGYLSSTDWTTFNNKVSPSRVLTAGAGLTGGGDLSADRTFAVGTPSTLTVSSANSASGTTHSHAITSSSNPGAAASLLATNASGQLALVDLLANGSTFNLVNATATTLNLGGAATTISFGAATGTATLNNATVALAGTLLNPVTGYNTDVGQLSKKFKAIYASELWVETLVAQNTIATIGGRILIGPTTSLIADLSAVASTMDVKHNQMSNGDRVYLEANGNVEFIAIASGPSTITGGYRYTITRDLDGTGANAWSAGDAVFNTGTTGNGFIDLYSVQAVKGSSQLGPTIVGNVRNSSTYNDWTENWAIGNLIGLYGYGSTTYGVGLGKYASGSANVTVDPTNGVRLRDYTTTMLSLDHTNGLRIFNPSGTVLSQWDMSGNLLVGETASNKGNVYISSGTVSIRRGTTDYITLNATDAQFTNLIKMSGSSAAISLGTTPPTSSTAGTGIWIDRDIINGVQANLRTFLFSAVTGSSYFGSDIDTPATRAISVFGTSATHNGESFGAGDLLLGDNSSGVANVRWNKSAGTFSLRRGTTNYITLSATDAQFTNLIKMSGSNAAISLGSTPPTSATAGTGIWLDRTGLYALSSNTQNVVLDSTGITTGNGGVKINYSGIQVTNNTQGLTLDLARLWGGTSSGISSLLIDVPASGTTGRVVMTVEGSTGSNASFTLSKSASGNGFASFDTNSIGTFAGVAIGGSAPSHMLDVYGTGWFQGRLSADAGVNSGNGYMTGYHDTFKVATNEQLHFLGHLNLVDGVTINSADDANSALKSMELRASAFLLSAGNVRMSNYGAGTLSTDASGNITACDERLKVLDAPFKRGLDDLLKIETPWIFRFKADLEEHPNIINAGFTAQQVQAIVPEAVCANKDGMLNYSDRALIAWLFNAVKELSCEKKRI